MSIARQHPIAVAEFGGLSCGMTCGVVAAAIAALPGWADASLVIALCTAGMMVGSVLVGILADAFGRVRTMTIGAGAIVLSSAFVLYGSWGSLLFGRFLQGAGVGVLFAVVPMYLSEGLSEDRRKRGVAFFQLFSLIGTICGALVGLLLTAGLRGGPWLWRILLAAPAVVALLFGAGTLIGLTPIDRGHTERTKWGFRVFEELLSKENRRSFVVAVAVAALVSALAAGPIRNLAVRMVQDIGLKGLGSNGVDVAIQSVALIATLVAVGIVNRLGTRGLLLVGVGGVLLSFVATAIAYACWCRWLAVASLVTFSAAFNFGPGVGVYLVINEMLPDRIRAVGVSVALLANHAVSVTVAALFMPCVASVGYPAVFLALAAFAGLLWAVVRFCLPRTSFQ